MGRFLGQSTRNDNYRLEDPHPIARYRDDQSTGSVAHDGFDVLSRARPDRQGSPPNVLGTAFPAGTNRGPDQSFEQ